MGIIRTFLARTGLVLGTAILASSGTFAHADFHSLLKSFRPKNELGMSILENASNKTAKLSIIDSWLPVGHALIVDADSRRPIQDLTSKGDFFELPAHTKVGIYFIPTLQSIGMTFRLQAGTDDPLEFNLKRQGVINARIAPIWKVSKESSKVTFNRQFFEKALHGACWTVTD